MHNAAYIALGSNMPHDGVAGPELLSRAVEALRADGLNLGALSSVWETEPWPPESQQPNYFNAAVALDPEGLSPQRLYRRLAAIEARFGRARRERWAPRTLDLDIIAMDGFVGTFGPVTLPHPRMHERAFVLAPLAEIAPNWVHPSAGKTAAEFLAALPGEGYRRVEGLAG